MAGFGYGHRPRLTVKLKGKEIEFDAQTGGDLQKAKDWHFQHGFKKYLGSNKVYYADGVKNTNDEIHHFFNR